MTKKRNKLHSSSGKYSTLVNTYGREEFFTRFLKRLNNLLIKNYGEVETQEILKLLNNKTISIVNPEVFLNNSLISYDPATKAYNASISITEFFSRMIIYCRKLQQEGCGHISLTCFLIYLTVILDKGKRRNQVHGLDPSTHALLDSFMATICGIGGSSPYVIELIGREGLHRAYELLGIKTNISYKTYVELMISIFNSYDFHSKLKQETKFPKIEMILTLDPYAELNQKKYLSFLFNITLASVKASLDPLYPLNYKSTELQSALELLRSQSNYPFIEIKDVIKELQRIEDKCTLRTYGEIYTDYSNLNTPFPHTLLKKYVSNFKYIPLENVNDLINPALCELRINCNKLSIDGIRVAVESAVKLGLIKFSLRDSFFQPKGGIRVILTNLHPLSKETISQINNMKKEIESLHNRNIGIIMEFKKEECETRRGDNFPTHIRIISDMHVDINEGRYNFDFSDDFIVNCGDTSGNCAITADWVKSNMRKGVFTYGNHLGYSQPYPELNGEENLPIHNSLIHELNTVGGQISQLAKEFSTTDLRFLSNSCFEYQGVVFVGTALFTDYCLYGEERKKDCMNMAKFRMNDFKYPKTFADWECNTAVDENKFIDRYENRRIVTPDPYYHLSQHWDAMRFLTEKVREFKGKPIVVFTHHAPLPYSIAPQYKNDPLSASFASDLTYFLKKFPYIRLWAHGHCVDSETEILTSNGWKNMNTITQEEKVLNLNINTNKIEEDNILGITKTKFTGKTYHFVSKGTDIRVTDEHRMLTLTSKRNRYKFMLARDFAKSGVRYAIRAGQQDKNGIELSDDMLRLLVWISADGNRATKTLIRFNLSKERKIERFTSLLGNLGIEYKRYVHRDGMDSINFKLPEELENFSFKPIDSRIVNCNREQAEIVLEEYSHSDGIKNGNTIIIYTSKKEEADSIQLMCITNNIACTLHTRTNHGFKLQNKSITKISYELYVYFKNYRIINNIIKSTTTENVKNENFWCVTTNNGTIITRRNGRVNITGNCHHNNDYIFGNTRFISCPFGYYNENNVDTLEYGKRISFADIRSKKSWEDLLKTEIKNNEVQVYKPEED